mgnify:CR=1 FL=1
MVRITMQNGKTIDIELDATAAPITCENFLKLVNQAIVPPVVKGFSGFHGIFSQPKIPPLTNTP